MAELERMAAQAKNMRRSVKILAATLAAAAFYVIACTDNHDTSKGPQAKPGNSLAQNTPTPTPYVHASKQPYALNWS